MNFSEKMLNLFGWKALNHIKGRVPAKAVVLSVPHTSYVDFFVGFFTYKALGIKAYFLIKQEAFFFPLGGLLRKVGGIPVRRGKNSVVNDVTKAMNESDEFILTIAPEGSRKPVQQWKTGYHRIARAANVPVIVGFLDYKTKSCGMLDVVDLTDDFEADTLKIMSYYKDIEGKYNEQFHLPADALK